MRATRSLLPTLRRLSLPWLMWLAVLLPLAQAAGAWHEIGHLGDAGAAEGRGKASHLGACVVCLGSPSATGAAPLVRHVAALRPPAVSFARPVSATVAAAHARSPAPYLSRAPPGLPT